MRIQQWCSHFHDPRPTAQNTLAEGQPQPMGSQPTKIWWNLTLSTENVQSYTNGFVRRSWLASKSQAILLQAWKTTLVLKLLKPSLRPENNKQPCRWTPVFLQWKCTEFSVGQPLTRGDKQHRCATQTISTLADRLILTNPKRRLFGHIYNILAGLYFNLSLFHFGANCIDNCYLFRE